MKLTSSNRLGYSHSPGGAANIVIINRMRRTIAMAKNSPRHPSRNILMYQTPRRINIGQSGKKTTAMTATRAPSAYSFILSCEPSHSQM